MALIYQPAGFLHFFLKSFACRLQFGERGFDSMDVLRCAPYYGSGLTSQVMRHEGLSLMGAFCRFKASQGIRMATAQQRRDMLAARSANLYPAMSGSPTSIMARSNAPVAMASAAPFPVLWLTTAAARSALNMSVRRSRTSGSRSATSRVSRLPHWSAAGQWRCRRLRQAGRTPTLRQKCLLRFPLF